jgi:hypothetical protein
MSSVIDEFIEIKNSRGILEAFKELSIGKVYQTLADPQNKSIRPLSRINRKLPRIMSFMVEWEARKNMLCGVVDATGEPIYPPSHFFRDQAYHYLTLTPGVGGKRAEQIVETLVAGALNSPQQKGSIVDLGMGEDDVLTTTKKEEETY